jgi:tRNA pseudouridine65 synthase/23S rRNA pseudouridine1911/1915/1917 synthase
LSAFKTHIVLLEQIETRLTDYVFENFDVFKSKASAKKAIKRGELLLNGELVSPAKYVKQGDCIDYHPLEEKSPKIFKLKLDILYEDDDLAVIYKPSGLVVSGNQYKTVQSALLYNLRDSAAADALNWPKPLHRIDSATSGLLLIAKTKTAQLDLSQQFEHKTIKKRYRAIVVGALPENGFVDTDIEGKSSYSEFHLVTKVRSLTNEYVSLADLSPHTGRTHQLRIHMASISHPIMGDPLYGKDKAMIKGKGLFLSAVELRFTHPKSKEELVIQVDQPQKFDSFLKREQERWERFH